MGALWPQVSKVLKPVRWTGSVPFPPCPCRGRLFVCCCSWCWYLHSGESLHCFLVGWCANKSYVRATSDLWLFLHASNLLPLLTTPLPYTYIIMTIIQGIQQRPLHHDYKQTQTLPVITIDSFQTSVTDVRCWKWFLETSQIITVTGQTHSRLYHYYIYIIQYYSSTRKYPELSLSCLASTHITPSLLLCCTLKLLLLFLKTSQTKSQPTVWPIADFI